jgi:hypothetical protein
MRVTDRKTSAQDCSGETVLAVHICGAPSCSATFSATFPGSLDLNFRDGLFPWDIVAIMISL